MPSKKTSSLPKLLAQIEMQADKVQVQMEELRALIVDLSDAILYPNVDMDKTNPNRPKKARETVYD